MTDSNVNEAVKPTQILSGEHRVILRVISCLERIVDAGAREGKINGDDARSAVAFFRTFADSCHHAKEEDALFPALVARGIPRENGPIAVMLDEHEIGRAAVRAMDEAIDGASGGDDPSLVRFVHSAREYIELLRQHIAKEDEVLFPMAEGVLDDAARSELLAAFERAELAHEEGTHERMLELANGLCDKYGVAADPEHGTSPCCGHHPKA